MIEVLLWFLWLIVFVLGWFGVMHLVEYFTGEKADEVIDGRPFPYVEYKGRHFPVLHSEYNRLWIEDPEREMSDSVDKLVNVGIELKDRVAGSYVAHEDGTAFITHWGK